MENITIRAILPQEHQAVADLLSASYYNDKFFIWSVPSDSMRHVVVAEYYKIYLGAAGCVAHVAVNDMQAILGAAVWLPHDVDAGIYDDIDLVTGEFSPQFRAVCDKSHDSEPPMTPFFQLVGFGVRDNLQGQGIGGKLLKYQLDILDNAGIPTYLEASTPYFGHGVYGKFGYQMVGELMHFAEGATLYPCWRTAQAFPIRRRTAQASPVRRRTASFGDCNVQPHENILAEASNLVRLDAMQSISFGGYDWYILEVQGDKQLLISKNVTQARYHNTFEDTNWEKSDLRRYLNTDFYNTFSEEEKQRIVVANICNDGNPWYETGSCKHTSDHVFILSIQEAVKYFGSSDKLCQPTDKFFIDDEFNQCRIATMLSGNDSRLLLKPRNAHENVSSKSSRWLLRTAGNANNFVSVVTNDGRISVTGDFVNRESTELFSVGVRPVIWVRV